MTPRRWNGDDLTGFQQPGAGAARLIGGGEDIEPMPGGEDVEHTPNPEDTGSTYTIAQLEAAGRGGAERAARADEDHATGRAREIDPASPDAPAPAPAPAAPGTRIGQYELIRLLGRGGMGEVHLARDLRLGRLVALKRLVSGNPGVNQLFLAEARTTARCHHENIVVIHEVGEHQDHPYMVLEYLKGQTLRQWLRAHEAAAAAGPGASVEPGRRAAVPPGRAVELMLPVVRALVYAHERGIIHRDLKPENVMLTRSGTIKVLDFGIAKLQEPGKEDIPPDLADDVSIRVTRTRPIHSSSLVGTLRYMAPEQMNEDLIDHRVDLWAVGVMLFELVAGVHPIPTLTRSALWSIADLSTPMPGVRELMPATAPDLGPLAAVIDRCLLKNREHRTASARVLLAELEALAPARQAALVGEGGSPFAGLAAFQEADSHRFFGRDRDIDQIVTELRSRPLVAVVGPSGAGKSSLVRAGVIPALKRSGEGWDAYVVRPGREPLAALAVMSDALAQEHDSLDGIAGLDGDAPVTRPGDGAAGHGPAVSEIIERLRAEPGFLGARLRSRATRKLRRILVFVDQLEELYTLGAPPDERAAFLAALVAAADDASSPLRVVVTMRSDFLDRVAEDRRLGAEIARGLVLLPPMGREGMREALLRPVEDNEYRFESPALVDRMVDALAATAGALPLLQFTAARLWELRDTRRRLLTEASYEKLGGVAGALAAHADAVLAGMPSAQQAVARAVFERLVTPERTRAPVSVAELHGLHQDLDSVDDTVQHLAAMRLVVIERGAEGADHTVELVHESLIERWPTLVRWLDENQDDAAMLARLRGAAREWERGGHAAGLLWTGEAAREAQAWQARYQGELASTEKRYLAAVLSAADRARRVRQRVFGGLLCVAVVVAIAMGWLAWQQARARSQAVWARELAFSARNRIAEEAARARDAARMAAIRALPEDSTTQLALLREIEHTNVPPPGANQEAKRLLHAVAAPVVLTDHDGYVWSAGFSPDGRRIVSASNRTVRVWNASGLGEPMRLEGHEDVVKSAAFSPDGQRIVSASDDRTVRVWDAQDGAELLVLRGHEDQVWHAAFSRDGRRIVSASRDGTARVWNADGSGEPVILRGHQREVSTAAFSPDGQRIVSASWDATIRVWNVDGRGEPLILRGHRGEVSSAAFSLDGQRIVSAAKDWTVRVWNADGSGEPLVLRGHDDVLWSAAFSPDGERIVSASYDRTMRVWNADGRGEPLVLRGHHEGVYWAEFSHDGQRIVSASEDRTVRVWNAQEGDEPMILRGHGGDVYAATFSPDGQRIASASADKTIRVWNADGSGEPMILRGHEAEVSSVAFSPDGQHIASASADKTIRVWNVDGSGEPLILRGHDYVIVTVAFSPDGQRIVSASWDRTVRVWNADGSGEPLVLRGHDDMVWSAAFSPDGQRIVTASYDRTVRVWNADGSGEPLVLKGHDDMVWSAAFSPDGQRIVSASKDRTVRLWNADGSGGDLAVFPHDAGVSSVKFSLDGHHIVSASKDGNVRIWRADGTGEPVILAGHTTWLNDARFSPDGRRIVSASTDDTVRVWHDLDPVTLDDPRLWTVTTYCIPVERRVKLLGFSEKTARRDEQRCRERVEEAHRGAALRARSGP